MFSTFKLLAVLQLTLTGLATCATHLPRQARQGPPLKRTNNNTWTISYANFNHPGPALTRQADNVGGISFTVRRTVWEKDFNARTMTFVPVAANKEVYCTYGTLEPVVKSEWRQCSGYQMENAPPGDESMTDELNKRLRFRLSDLKTSPLGNFESVTVEIVNHVAARKQVLIPRYMHGDVPNAPGAWDRVPMVVVFSIKVVYKASAAKCSLRDENMTVGKRWEECSFGARTPLVQEETITDAAFEQKYWKLGGTSLQSECPV